MKEIDLTTYDPISHFAIAVGIAAALHTIVVFIAGIIFSILYEWWLFILIYMFGGALIALEYTGGMLLASYVSNVWEIKRKISSTTSTNHTQETNIFKNMNKNVNMEKKTTVMGSETPVTTSKKSVDTSKAPTPTSIVKTTIECPSCFTQNDIHAQRCKECGCPLK